MGILQRIFEKRGIKNAKELSPEEQATFKSWEAILSKEEMTMDDLKRYCQVQCEVIEGKWADLTVDNHKKAELIPYHTVYRLIKMAIDSPRIQREQLEIQLNDLLKT